MSPMLTAISSWLVGKAIRLRLWASSLLAAGLLLVGLYRLGHWRGAKEAQDAAQADSLRNELDSQEAGRSAVQRGRDSRLDLVDRLRKNDGAWK